MTARAPTMYHFLISSYVLNVRIDLLRQDSKHHPQIHGGLSGGGVLHGGMRPDWFWLVVLNLYRSRDSRASIVNLTIASCLLLPSVNLSDSPCARG